MVPLAAMLERHGWTTTVPDLRSSVSSAARFGRSVLDAAHAVDVVIGHSGAGVFLPAAAAAADVATAVFVDAVVPPAGPLFAPPRQLIELLDALPIVDGMLPPWDRWWPPEVLEDLIPDETLRGRLAAENPQVSRSFYDDTVPLPPQWWRNPAAYLQLSSAYADDRARADGWGWPTAQIAGRHLDVGVRAELVAEHIVDLMHQERQRRG